MCFPDIKVLLPTKTGVESADRFDKIMIFKTGYEVKGLDSHVRKPVFCHFFQGLGGGEYRFSVSGHFLPDNVRSIGPVNRGFRKGTARFRLNVLVCVAGFRESGSKSDQE